jgi:hypothetical protein
VCMLVLVELSKTMDHYKGRMAFFVTTTPTTSHI